MWGIWNLDNEPYLINTRETKRNAVATVKMLRKVHANKFGIGKLQPTYAQSVTAIKEVAS